MRNLAELRCRLDDIQWFHGDDATDEEIDAYSEAGRMAYETIRVRVHDALKLDYPEFADEIDAADYPI